jgi:Ala-tRNA(Pro) deacylase
MEGERSMSIAATLQKHLSRKRIVYDVVSHSPTMGSVLSAEACCVSPDRVAKGVVVRTEDRYVLAVLPASRRINCAELKMELGESFALASENELEQLFEDCVPGAAPPVGEAYGLDAVVEPSICDQPDVYFEGGDHATLVHMTQTQFAKLIGVAVHSRFAAGE